MIAATAVGRSDADARLREVFTFDRSMTANVYPAGNIAKQQCDERDQGGDAAKAIQRTDLNGSWKPTSPVDVSIKRTQTVG
jgi:hypothetical protein